MRIKRAEKYGFCAGVRIADRKVKKFAAAGGRGAILGQVVHNERVVHEMEELGVRTVEALDEVGEGTIVFSAHGVPPSFLHTARRRGLQVLDTTCPFVYDVHDDAQAALAQGLHLAFIGDPRHREIIGYTHDLDPAAYHVVSTVEEARAVDWASYPGVRILYQTTLNAEEYEAVATAIEAAGSKVSRTDTICYATKENQEAALLLAQDPEVQAILIIGGRNSANTRHLWEICARVKPSYLVHGADDLRAEWLDGVEVLGVTAGASTPDYLIDEVEAAAQELRGRLRVDLVSAAR
ncbi:MAG TPA: 4-hydroxy-3-methylbut-2-enyl diphosphate reductase [Thermoanaerobaculia bacterium]|nr:4-hydroxy-3-methylbut-2-enyl diphosphate reductase [Thermoanaerobaculia bacterium]